MTIELALERAERERERVAVASGQKSVVVAGWTKEASDMDSRVQMLPNGEWMEEARERR